MTVSQTIRPFPMFQGDAEATTACVSRFPDTEILDFERRPPGPAPLDDAWINGRFGMSRRLNLA